MQFWAAKLSAFDVLKAITCWIFFHDFIAHHYLTQWTKQIEKIPGFVHFFPEQFLNLFMTEISSGLKFWSFFSFS